LWARFPPRSCMSVGCECCVLSGRGLCDKLITRPEESYRLWCVVVCDLETWWMRKPWPTGGLLHQKTLKKFKFCTISRRVTMVKNAGCILQCSMTEVSFVFYRPLSAAETMSRSSGRRLWVRTPITILVFYALKVAWRRKNTHLWPLRKTNSAIRTIDLEISGLQSPSNLPDPEFLIIIIIITDHSDRMR
jgi:hypothetical protein